MGKEQIKNILNAMEKSYYYEQSPNTLYSWLTTSGSPKRVGYDIYYHLYTFHLGVL